MKLSLSASVGFSIHHSCLTPPMSNNLCFFFFLSGDPRDLHSFPTRRSSDPGDVARVLRRLSRLPEVRVRQHHALRAARDRKSPRLNSSHRTISYPVF